MSNSLGIYSTITDIKNEINRSVVDNVVTAVQLLKWQYQIRPRVIPLNWRSIRPALLKNTIS